MLAVIFGRSAKKDIASRPGLGGEGLATAGVILGWIGIAYGILGVLFFAFVFSSFPGTP